MNKELEQRNQAPVVKGKDIHRWNAKEMMQILWEEHKAFGA